jgi:hypothetical protein
MVAQQNGELEISTTKKKQAEGTKHLCLLNAMNFAASLGKSYR